MGKGIILRVMDGTVLSPELVLKLGELLPDYVLETYQQTPNYKLSYTKRVESLYNAFLFIMDAYPPDRKFTPLTIETLTNYATECKAGCSLKKESVDDLQKELDRFTEKLVEILVNNWNWKGGKAAKEAIACLNEAECYQLMMEHGRLDLATLTTIDTEHGKEYVLQLDKSLPPQYELLVAELGQLKGTQYPKTPLWFNKAPAYQQAYFCNLNLDTISASEVVQDLNKFMTTWEEIKGRSFNLSTELKQIQSNFPPYAAWYNELSVPLKEMIKVLAAHPGTITSNLKQFKQMLAEQANRTEFKNSLEVVASLPHWYWVLSHRQQYFLEHVLKNAQTIEEAVAFVSSRHRALPLPSNFAAHSLYTINAKNEVILHFDERYRSSHVASRDSLNDPDAVQSRHSDANLAKVMEKAKAEQPFLMQTLISPIHAVDYVPTIVSDFLPELPPDLELYKLARAAASRSKRGNIWQHNHPYNIAKLYYYTQSNDVDSLALLENAQKFVSKTPGLQELLDDYKSALESPLGSATFWDYDGRELFLSSLEQLITLTIGGFSYGSCVSGKDRKALELLHTDAMILYKHKYGVWPKFGDPKEKEERICFVNIFVGLYISRHQHEHAGQNAPGSEGIKTPGWYLPKDIADAINKALATDRGLEFDDRLATNNEVKNISTSLKSIAASDEFLCKLMAKQLGEDTCTKLYDALWPLVNQTTLFHYKSKDSWGLSWHKKETTNSPTGIEQMRKLMRDKQSGSNSVERFGQIFSIALKRPEIDPTRTAATNSVYDHMREILKPTKLGVSSSVAANEAIKEWQELFEASKETNLGLSYQ